MSLGFAKKSFLLRLAVVLVVVMATFATIPVVYRSWTPSWSSTWPRFEHPEMAGVNTIKLEHARGLAEQSGASAVVIIFEGKLLAAWGRPATVYPCHSVRKSYLSALFGKAVADGQVSLDATLGELGIDDVPSLTAQEKTATVRDLLQARSGVYHQSNAASERSIASLPPRDSRKPGELWVYQNWDFNALGTIYRNATGKTVFDAFDQQIARPLRMEHFDPVKHTRWITSGASLHPAYEFRMTALDMARFGQLMLQEGEWEGKLIVPRTWVRESTIRYSTVDDGKAVKDQTDARLRPGYGYMWWVGTVASALGNPPELEGSYSAEGTGGHMILVAPKLKMVVVVRANTWLPAWTPLVPTRVDSRKLVPAIREIIEAVGPAVARLPTD